MTVRIAYDAFAGEYADHARDELDRRPLERGLLAAFAEMVGGATVADLGCGPGRLTAHLCDLGVPAFGVDLSPEMIAVARRDHPDLRFEVGTLLDLDLPDEKRGLELDVWWLSPAWVESRLADAGFVPCARLEREAHSDEIQPQAFILARNK